MIPNSEGVWRWIRKDDGREFDLPVYEVVRGCMRVYYLGSYYDVEDFEKGGKWIAKVNHNPDGPITKQLPYWVHPDDKVSA